MPLKVQQVRLVGGDHVLDVDEGVFTVAPKASSVSLDQVADVLPLLLAVVDAGPREFTVHANKHTERPVTAWRFLPKVLCIGLGTGLQGLCAFETQACNV